jgi:hypothetical protein
MITRTKSQEDWYGVSGIIKVTPSTIWEAAVLVLLMIRIYDISRYDDLRKHNRNIPSFMTNGSVIQVTLQVTAWEILVYSYIIQMDSGSMISFMKNGSGVQTILKLHFNSLNGCNNGISDIRGLRIGLIWKVANDEHRDFHGNWYRRSSNFKVLLRKLERLILVLLMGHLWCMSLKWAQGTWYMCQVPNYYYYYG